MRRNRSRRSLRWLTAAVLSFAVLFAAGTPAAAQATPDSRGFNVEDGGRITIDVKDRPLKDVVDYIRDKTKVNIIVAPEAEGEKVTLSVNNLNWLKALELVAERAECILVQDDNLVKVEKPPQVSFDFQDADVRKVISVIAAYSGANIVVGQEVQGTVTVRLNRVPWRSALDTVVKTLGFVVVEDQRKILRVTDPTRLQEQLETRVYTFRFVRPPAPYVAHIKTDVQLDSVRAPSDDPEDSFPILRAFRAAVAPEGTLEYVPASNSIVVTGTSPKLDELEQLIKQVDIEPVMVGVDIQFITTRNQDFLEAGFDPGEEGWTVSMDLGSMTHRLPFNLGDGGWEDSLSAEGYVTNPGPPIDYRGTGPDPIASGTGFSYGRLDFTGVSTTLRLLKEDRTARIVQAPRILTLDNQQATIFVGETIRYAKTDATSAQSGGLEFSIDEADSSPVQTGFQMLVIPHVIPDSSQIMMTVIPTQRALTGNSVEQPGFNIFTSGTGLNEVQIALPQEASQTIITHMMLESGETAVMGGLLTETESLLRRGIPVLGDLPVIGFFFSIEQISKTKDNLLIMITPHILKSAEQRRTALSKEIQDQVKRIRDEFEEVAGDVSEVEPLELDEQE